MVAHRRTREQVSSCLGPGLVPHVRFACVRRRDDGLQVPPFPLESPRRLWQWVRTGRLAQR